MARPLSEAKREAILEAACRLVAEHGTGAPTAKIAKEAKLADPIIARQLERTDLSHARIGPAQVATIRAAGEALQAAGVIQSNIDIAAVSRDLVDASLGPAAS